MDADVSPFQFDYAATGVVFGRGSVDRLGSTMADRGLSRALVVCGTNVGANRAVMAPITAGFGDRLAGVFDETTPAKDLETVLDGRERFRAADADAVVTVGGGSSMAIGRSIAAIAPLDRSDADVAAAVRKTDTVPVPDEGIPTVPIIAVPTTMAGADLASSGGIMVTDGTDTTDGPGARRSVRAGDPRLMPEAVYFDPALFATTPMSVLAGSAMNGFNKGIETVYSRTSTPPAVAHALYGLRYLHAGLLELRAASPDDRAFDHAALGMSLVQYGRQTNIIHTFGNGVSFHYDVQQGAVHGIMAPHVLRYVFEHVDGERHLLANALDIRTADRTDAAIATAVIDAVVAVRDALDLPDRLRIVGGLAEDDLPAVADEIAASHKHARDPPGLDPTPSDVLEVLEAAW